MIAVEKNRISKKFFTLIAPFLLVNLTIAGVVWLQYPEIKKRDSQLTQREYQNQEQKERQKLAFSGIVPSFGFNNVLADWFYLNFIQYFGDVEARNKIGYSLIPDYFATIVEKDPHFTNAIYQMEVSNSLFAGLPEISVRLLEKSLQSIKPKFIVDLPTYYLWRSKGNSELLFLGDVAAAKKSYQKSIDWAEAYDDDDSKRIIAISRNSLRSLTENPNSKSAQIGAWISVLANRPDEKTIKRVIENIEALGGKVIENSNGRVIIKIPE
jgi:hypothetical protein